jgi:hypothetical protein
VTTAGIPPSFRRKLVHNANASIPLQAEGLKGLFTKEVVAAADLRMKDQHTGVLA